MNKPTAVVGASTNPERYSNMAIVNLKSNGHTVYCVSPKGIEVEGCEGFKSLTEINEPVDSISLYIGAKHQGGLLDEILAIKPKRVIFNPGTENSDLFSKLQKNGIIATEACTLVMLSVGNF
jgi:uncharacterized protein